MRSSARLSGQRRNYAESDDEDVPRKRPKEDDASEPDSETQTDSGTETDSETDSEVFESGEESEGEEDEYEEENEHAERLRDAKDYIQQKLGMRSSEVRSAVSALHFFYTYTEHTNLRDTMDAIDLTGLGPEELDAAVRIGMVSSRELELPHETATEVFAPMCKLMSGAWQSVLVRLDTAFALALCIEAALKFKTIKQRIAGGAETAETAVARLVLSANGVDDPDFVEFFVHQFDTQIVEELAQRMRALVRTTISALTPCARLRCVVLKLVDAHKAAKEEGVLPRFASSAPGAPACTNTRLYDSWRPRGVREMVEKTPGLCYVSVYLGTYVDAERSWLGERCALLFDDAPGVGTPGYYEYRQVLLQANRMVVPLHAGEYTLCQQDAVTDVLNKILRRGNIGAVVRQATDLFVATRVTSVLHTLGRASASERHQVSWMQLCPEKLVETDRQKYWLTPRYELPSEHGGGAQIVTFFVLCNERPLCLKRRSQSDRGFCRSVVRAPVLRADAKVIVHADETEKPVTWREDLSDVGGAWSDETYARAVAFLKAGA